MAILDTGLPGGAAAEEESGRLKTLSLLLGAFLSRTPMFLGLASASARAAIRSPGRGARLLLLLSIAIGLSPGVNFILLSALLSLISNAALPLALLALVRRGLRGTSLTLSPWLSSVDTAAMFTAIVLTALEDAAGGHWTGTAATFSLACTALLLLLLLAAEPLVDGATSCRNTTHGKGHNYERFACDLS